MIHRIGSERERACDLFSESSVRLRPDCANAGVDGLRDIDESRGANRRTNRDRFSPTGDADAATRYSTDNTTASAAAASRLQSSERADAIVVACAR